MRLTKLIKYSFLLAVLLALCISGIALAEGDVEPNGSNSIDCDGSIKVNKVINTASSEPFDFIVYRSGSTSTWASFSLIGKVVSEILSLGTDCCPRPTPTPTSSWSWSPSSWSDFGKVYTITETIDSSDPWLLYNISCTGYNSDDSSRVIDITTVIASDHKSGYASFVFEDYDNVDCTFTNIAEPSNYDFGDLPESDDPYDYNMTTYTNDGARHITGALFLGSSVDGESDGQPNQLATGDDDNNNDDEDGGVRIAVAPDYWMAGNGEVEVTVGGIGNGCFSGWMDIWNSNSGDLGQDGDFDDSGVTGGGVAWSENIIVNQPVSGGNVYNFKFNLPPDSGTYSMYARFRLVPDANGDGVCSESEAPQLTGLVTNGEVEDYVFLFESTAVALKGFAATPFNANTAVLVSSVLGIGLLGVFFSARKKS